MAMSRVLKLVIKKSAKSLRKTDVEMGEYFDIKRLVQLNSQSLHSQVYGRDRAQYPRRIRHSHRSPKVVDGSSMP